MLRERGDLRAAANELHVAVTQLPDDPDGHQLLGTVLLKSNDLFGAIEEFRAAIRLNPNLAETHANLAQAFRKAGDEIGAAHELAELETLNRQKSNAGESMILVETVAADVSKGELREAADKLQKAASLSPDFLEAHYQLGVTLKNLAASLKTTAEKESKLRQAEEQLHAVLQLEPNHAAAHMQLGLVLESEGKLREARAELQTATRSAPGLLAAHRALARLAVKQQDWTTDISELQAALAWVPEDSDVHYELAAALKASGHPHDAARELEIATKLSPRTGH